MFRKKKRKLKGKKQGCGSGSWKRWKRLHFCGSGSIFKKEAGNRSKLESD